MDPFTADPGLHFWLMGMALLLTAGCGFFAAFARMLVVCITFGLGAAYSFAMLVWLTSIALS